MVEIGNKETWPVFVVQKWKNVRHQYQDGLDAYIITVEGHINSTFHPTSIWEIIGYEKLRNQTFPLQCQ